MTSIDRNSEHPVKPQVKSSHTACERCYRYKEKCTFDRIRSSCTRCTSLNAKCHLRARKRMGRRPVVRQFSMGFVDVTPLEKRRSTPATTSVLRCNATCNGTGYEAPSASTAECASQSITRCPCANVQNVLRNATAAESVCRYATVFGESKGSCSRLHLLLKVLETPENFFEVHRPFMLGTSFVDVFRSTVRRLTTHSPSLLADGYYIAMKSLATRHAKVSSLDTSDLELAARCLGELNDTSSKICSLEDAAVTLLLGQTMLVCNTLIPSPSTQTITQAMLLKVKDWYPALLERADVDAVTLTPVLMDIVECLIRRELPIISPSATNRCVVDRFVGVRSSLLPLLYELCERSYETKTQGDAVSKVDPYNEIEGKVREWIPKLPSDFCTAYSPLEVRIMLAQARAYRLAALLLIHRLRFPLGKQDDIAKVYASDILQELHILHTWPRSGATGLGLDFPLLMASLELPDQGAKVYAICETLRFRRQHSNEILEFLNFVTQEKRNGYDGLWFELLHGRLRGITLT